MHTISSNTHSLRIYFAVWKRKAWISRWCDCCAYKSMLVCQSLSDWPCSVDISKSKAAQNMATCETFGSGDHFPSSINRLFCPCWSESYWIIISRVSSSRADITQPQPTPKEMERDKICACEKQMWCPNFTCLRLYSWPISVDHKVTLPMSILLVT
jgi:hypothetical protein